MLFTVCIKKCNAILCLAILLVLWDPDGFFQSFILLKRSVGSMFYTACINERNAVLCYCRLFSCVMGISPWWIYFIRLIACMPVDSYRSVGELSPCCCAPVTHTVQLRCCELPLFEKCALVA